jgi:hypothetical protein
MLASLEPQLAALHHAAHESVAVRELVRKLTPRHHRGVHLAPQRGLGRRERARQLRERGLAKHHQVHVATGTLGAAGHAAVNEGQFHLGPQRFQRRAQHVCKPCCLAQQLRQLSVYGVGDVGAVVHLPPDLLPQKQAHVGQKPQLAVQ